MTKKSKLKCLIAELQKAITNGGMPKQTVDAAIKNLAELGYQYDYERFPALVGTKSFTDTSRTTPTNLAEALIWKLGK